MAKDNLFLGFGRGKVGDVVFYRLGGQQVARARNRSPRNPQTALQLLQRVVLKTTGLAYSLLQDITNHSFQGLAEGTESQSRFARLNIAAFRRRLQTIIDSGDEMEILSSAEANFSKRSDSTAAFNDYIVSEGTLPVLSITATASAPSDTNIDYRLNMAFDAGDWTAATITYQQVCDFLGLQRGDQLTFLALSVDDSDAENSDPGKFNGFRYARVILEPSDGDMTKAFVVDGAINDPNPRNEGDVRLTPTPGSAGSQGYISFAVGGISLGSNRVDSMAAGTVIASRLSGSIWQRSSQRLVLRGYLNSDPAHLIWDHGTDYLSDAIASYMTATNSSLYLNQASNF